MVPSRTRTSRPDQAPFHAPQGVHLVLSAGIPTAFCSVAGFLLGGEIPSWPQVIALVYTVLVSFWASWRLRTRQGPWTRLWLWLMLTLGLYAGESLLEGLPWPNTFVLGGMHLMWFLMAFIQGQLGVLWASQLASRARLFQLTEGIPDGRQLEQLVHDYQLDADFSRTNRTVLTVSLGAMAGIAAVLASVTRYGQGGVAEGLFAAFLVLCLLAGVLVRVYRREMEAMMYGRRWTLAEKLAPLGWSSLLVVLAGASALALMAAGGPWMGNLFAPQIPDVHIDPTQGDAPTTPNLPAGRDLRLAVLVALIARILRLENLSFVLVFIVRATAVAAPLVAAAFFLWPLVQWARSGGRDTRGLWRRWSQLLAAQWRAFLATLAAWWGKPVVTVGVPLGATAVPRWLRSFFKSKGTARRPLPEVVDAFLRLVARAEPMASYRRGQTTREYLNTLAAALPGSAADLEAVRELLEVELFGPGLDSPSLARLLALVDSVIKLAFHEGSTGVF